MPGESATTDRIDYIQRCGDRPQPPSDKSTAGDPGTRRLVRVRGIGRPDKVREPWPGMADEWQPATASLITGLYGYRIPLAYSLIGSAAGVEVRLGTWSARGASGDIQERRSEVIQSVLRGLYPVVELEPATETAERWPLGGMALGIPAPGAIDVTDSAAPIDKIIRAMTGTDWAVLVLAYPAGEDAISDVRSALLNEMRTAESAAKNEGAPSPLTEHYVDLLKISLAATGDGMATGAWRTGVYLLGTGESYPRLATAWRSVMSGSLSLPEPVRVVDAPEADALAAAWAMPDDPGVEGPGHFRRPFEWQTLLSTAQLAACVHLPELEAPGFTVDLVPRFDAVAPTASGEGPRIEVGRVLHNRQPTSEIYSMPLASLTKHVFVAGMTGAGKTNSIMSLLTDAAAAGVPFLVVEPAKTEYRVLIDHPKLGSDLRVFTAGKATVAPFVLNPFEVPAGTAVSEHLDLLRMAFTAAFGMWSPLPQILERCLHDVYIDRGWDLRTNKNVRLGENDATGRAFPTMSDLIAKIIEVMPTLGYEDRVTGDMRAALVTRLDSLRQGAKGAMLDVTRSLPPEELFGQPAVIELEPMGDEGDKAFVAALLVIRLAEHRRTQGMSRDLRHLLVIEEAHRLLSNVPTQVTSEEGNPRGQAVETFSNLLSEVRAYGQGVIIADQVPVRLAPDVMKNTNLKIAHRVVSADDREALAGAMAMDARQAMALTSLDVGEAALFSAGDDAPLVARMPLVKDPIAPRPPPDDRVREHMEAWRVKVGLDQLFLPREFCAETCLTRDACDAARSVCEDEYVQRTFARMVQTAIDEEGGFDRLWEDMTTVLRARRPPRVPEDQFLRAFAGHGSDWFASRRGAQEVWSYADMDAFRQRLQAVVLDTVTNGKSSRELVHALQENARALFARKFEPFPACSVVCTQDPPLCLYRSAVADVVLSGRHHEAWYDADDADSRSEENRRQQTWEVCQDAAFEIVEFPDDDQPPEVKQAVELAARRVCLCFEQQMLLDDRRKVPRTSRRILARVLAEAGL